MARDGTNFTCDEIAKIGLAFALLGSKIQGLASAIKERGLEGPFHTDGGTAIRNGIKTAHAWASRLEFKINGGEDVVAAQPKTRKKK